MARRVDRRARDLDVLAGDDDLAALGARLLARRRQRAGNAHGLFLAAARWAELRPGEPVAAPSTIRPFFMPTEFASITPLVLITESTTRRAAAAVSSTRPPLALSLPVLVTSDLSDSPVATSFTSAAI